MNSAYNHTIVDLFCEQARKTPDAIAVMIGDKRLTYRALDEQSSQLAHYLLAQGVQTETLVGICLERSLDMIIGILGIMKAGGAYVPIDPDYPKDRIAYVLTDIKAQIVLGANLSLDRLTDISGSTSKPFKIINLQETALYDNLDKSCPDLSCRLGSDNLAYIIYTSGSTGRPKGVMITHRNVVRLFFNDQPLFDFNERDVWTMFHSFCFDFSVWEMYGALLFGGRVVIVPKHTAQDANLFAQLLHSEGVTILNQTPSAFYVLQDHLESLASPLPLQTRYLIFGGEALNPAKLKPWRASYPTCRLINMYGITETTVHVTYQEIMESHLHATTSVIGVPIPTLYAYVLNEGLEKLPADTEGELFVGGDGLARGYLNLPELTHTRFIDDPFSDRPDARLYRTGDLVKMSADGTLTYLGRIDNQVKIRGFRIELGEIEHTLQQLPEVQHGVVVAQQRENEDTQLIGYYVATKEIEKDAVLGFLRSRLPDYMVPRVLIEVDMIPLTSNGKVDKKALPSPGSSQQSSTTYVAAQHKTEILLAGIWKTLLQLDRVGRDDNFFELGGNSLLAQKMTTELRRKHVELAVIKLYQYPVLKDLAHFIDGGQQPFPKVNHASGGNVGQLNDDVAIIGMAGRFPGANTPEELWENLANGKECIRFFEEEELDPSIPLAERLSPDYVPARGIIDNATDFDASFFGINARQAELMDPQHRVFLEISWEALENAGYVPQKFEGRIGVYAGCANNTYFANNVLANPAAVEQAGGMQVLTASDKDYIATKTAYHLDLKGPAVTVLSACSTSLLAVAQAVESIRRGQCEIALAGAASITSPIHSGHIYEEGAMLSKDGHCRPFDDNAQGTLFSDGAAVVVLKSKKQAELDGDTIFAVIRGVGVSNDGGGKASFTAPSATGQANCIRMAIDDARVNPADISYIETHGTATPLGDPIEIEGLKLAFGPQLENQYCKIGSIKSNLGHLTHAAGVAGLIKTALSLHYRKLVPSINFKSPNPNINFVNSPFVVNDKLADWEPREGKWIAGVSSFGVGGTNVHVIVNAHEPHAANPVAEQTAARRGSHWHIATLSARSEKSLERYVQNLVAYLDRNPSCNIGEIAYTLQERRQGFEYRQAYVASDIDGLRSALMTNSKKPSIAGKHSGMIAFMFPGQGSQYVNMGKELYEHEPVFRQAVDDCALLLEGLLQEDIRDTIYADASDDDANARLTNTQYTQPALFVTEYALAKLWISWGITPTAFIGHSIGEFVAAHLAGVFSLADALKLVAARGRLITALPSGSMLSIRAHAEKIRQMLPQGINLAAVNAPSLCVVAGDTALIRDFKSQLDKQQLANKLLETSHAFHSEMMEPILEPLANVFADIQLHIPNKPIVSTVTGMWLTDEEATSVAYWVQHVQATVRFSDALLFLEKELSPLFLEIGPGTVLATLARQHGDSFARRTIEGLRKSGEHKHLYGTVGNVWSLGIQPNWKTVNPGQWKLVALPPYAFDRRRYWLPAKPASQNVVTFAPVLDCTSTSSTTAPTHDVHSTSLNMNRKDFLVDKLVTLLADASGIEIDQTATNTSLIELGFDSLLLTQVSLRLKREFGVPVTFRGLSETYDNVQSLAEYLDNALPAAAFNEPAASTQPIQPPPVAIQADTRTQPLPSGSDAINLISQQIALLSQQISMIQQANPLTSPPSPEPSLGKPTHTNGLTPAEATELKKPFGATARIDRNISALTDSQRVYLNRLIDQYTEKTGKSKSFTQQHRAHMADPRVVSGFKPETKEMVYSIVVNRSKGCRLWDIDGNEYIDVLNGFGSNFLGYQPDFIKKALIEQIEDGYEIGPQHEKSGAVANLVCELTGFDRVGLCNTGSEAVLGAMRIARTVTGRSTIVAFTNSYHGIMDEVIARGTKKLKTYPAAPGILPEAVQNMLILDYGTEESMRIIRERANELAAVLVEPIQSRRPEFVPVDFLRELRAVTEQAGTTLIFDEVISGFRFHPRGAQGLFNIKADIATYGKVAGAGISVGIIAGKKHYMDALDGGFWQYGDDSIPEAGVTYFAGTFVRHPLALATTLASLEYLKEQGPQLQETVNARTKTLVDRLNSVCERYRTPLFIAHFGSLWKVKYHEEYPYSELLFTAMRLRGIHIQDGFPCFLTTVHTDEDVARIAEAFETSVEELVQAGFIPTAAAPTKNGSAIVSKNATNMQPPVPNARLGKDSEGNPAWFVEDENNAGRYLQVQL